MTATAAAGAPLEQRSAAGAHARLIGRLAVLLELGPFAVFYAAVFLAPLALLVVYSFFRREHGNVVPAFQVDAYVTALTDPLFYQVVWNTVIVGLATAVACVVIAYPFVYTINFIFPRWKGWAMFLVLVTLFAGYLARIYAWRTLLGVEGIINSILVGSGLIQEPLRFLLFSRFAVVLTMLSIYLPFAVLPINAAMQNVGRDVVEAARDLGGGRLTAFRTVTLPITFAGFRSAFLFCFLLSAGDYVTPALVGGPDGLMVGNVIRDQFYAANNWPLGAALSVLTVVFVLAIFLVVDRLVRLVTR
jgi:spermidine/putrescine transport system permease protein